jgi:hypothetical protein
MHPVLRQRLIQATQAAYQQLQKRGEIVERPVDAENPEQQRQSERNDEAKSVGAKSVHYA